MLLRELEVEVPSSSGENAWGPILKFAQQNEAMLRSRELVSPADEASFVDTLWWFIEQGGRDQDQLRVVRRMRRRFSLFPHRKFTSGSTRRSCVFWRVFPSCRRTSFGSATLTRSAIWATPSSRTVAAPFPMMPRAAPGTSPSTGSAAANSAASYTSVKAPWPSSGHPIPDGSRKVSASGSPWWVAPEQFGQKEVYTCLLACVRYWPSAWARHSLPKKF